MPAWKGLSLQTRSQGREVTPSLTPPEVTGGMEPVAVAPQRTEEQDSARRDGEPADGPGCGSEAVREVACLGQVFPRCGFKHLDGGFSHLIGCEINSVVCDQHFVLMN